MQNGKTFVYISNRFAAFPFGVPHKFRGPLWAKRRRMGGGGARERRGGQSRLAAFAIPGPAFARPAKRAAAEIAGRLLLPLAAAATRFPSPTRDLAAGA